MYKNLWKTACHEINIPFVYSRKFPSFCLIFCKILRLVLLRKESPKKRRANSNLNAERNNFLTQKTVRLVLGLYL